MHFPENIYTFFAKEQDPISSYQRHEDPPINATELKAKIKQLISKHQSYQLKYAVNSKVYIRAQNKIIILTYCLNYLTDCGTLKHLLNEQAKQDKLPADERYNYNDSWWPVVGLGYFWQTLPSETANVVETTKQYVKEKFSQSNFFADSDALFKDEEEAIQQPTPPNSPRSTSSI